MFFDIELGASKSNPRRFELEEVSWKTNEINKSVKRREKYNKAGSDHGKRNKDKRLWDWGFKVAHSSMQVEEDEKAWSY